MFSVKDTFHWVAKLHVADSPIERLLLLDDIDLPLGATRGVHLLRWA